MKVSIDDLERFFGKAGSVGEYKVMLEYYSCSFTCLTCGKDGVWYKEKNGDWHFQQALAVPEVIDTTGAGDAFWAGFMSALLDHQTFDDCITNALGIAARKIQKKGPLFNTSIE